ncbi:MAG: 5-(carboxyamino)imidazole ribonucleotide mutase [Patescibacteria group bacterium]
MTKPLVGIIMGSDSDLPVMQEAAKVCEEFGVEFEITVCSAHRSPERAHEYATTAISRGLKVIIAGAGGSAHLAGVTAALTTLPVIGVPINGQDALFSTVQMPPGIPVATVGINSARNAGLLAIQILATSDTGLAKKFSDFKKSLADGVAKKADKLQKLGYEKYLTSN